MTVAELARRFETACVEETTSHTHHLTPSPGRVKELTRRLEQAVIDNATPPVAFDPPQVQHHTHQPVKQHSSPPASPPSASSLANESPIIPFPSPPSFPRVSQQRSNTHLSPPSCHTRPRFPSPTHSRATPNIPSIQHLPSTSKISHVSKIIDAAERPSSVHNTPPAHLSVFERLAVYEQLTVASEPLPISNNPPTTPSTVFSSNSSVLSSQPHAPIDLIPDVSEGDLDDIEGVERVDDEASIHSTPHDDDDNATFRRTETVQILPSSVDSQSSHHSCQPANLPSNPSTSSNASENSSFSSAGFALAIGEFQDDRPAPHTLAVPATTAPRQESDMSAQPHTLQIAPGSFMNLPKAKVMIARRRGHEEEKDDPGTSNDDASTRKLIREYEHPKELLEGSVSLVELSDENDDEAVEFRDPDVSDVKRETSMMQKKNNRAEAFRHRYDEFMDPQEIERLNDNMPADEGSGSNSKERYQRRRLFRRGKVERARQREERLARQREAVTRRSMVISGALDRVSLAADPWIDFITDTNTLPMGKAAGGGIRRGLKKLFGLGRQNGRQNAGLIKTGK